MIGLILASGYSRKLRMMGINQSATVKVRWEGNTEPLIVTQIRMLKNLTSEVFVSVGWMRDEVVGAVTKSHQKVVIFEDRHIRGAGLVWQQLLNEIGERNEILSVECSRLHGLIDMLEFAKTAGWNAVGMVNGRGRYRYTVDGAYVKSIGAKLEEGMTSSGVYLLDGAKVCACPIDYSDENKEFSGDVVVKYILNTEKVRAIPITQYLDVEEDEGIRKVMVR